MSERATTRNRGRNRRDQNSDAAELQDTLGAILARLTALENISLPATSTVSAITTPEARAIVAPGQIVMSEPPQPAVPESNTSIVGESLTSTATSLDATDRLIGALSALTKVRSNHYYISNFDPSIHDIDSWCEEVERARDINRWDDNECLSRIANCLKGDARSWLNDWVTNDRTWSNFKIEFKPLCSRRIDIANILFDVMSTNSDKYSTYAEYARRSILRLNIVRGLSDNLTVAIVIRGITDAQVRAAATNAHLTTKDLVEFFSIYTKPNSNSSVTSVKPSQSKQFDGNFRKRQHNNNKSRETTCFSCGSAGHIKSACPKQSKTVKADESSETIAKKPNGTCSFCKKPGHDASVCFAKQRSENRQ